MCILVKAFPQSHETIIDVLPLPVGVNFHTSIWGNAQTQAIGPCGDSSFFATNVLFLSDSAAVLGDSLPWSPISTDHGDRNGTSGVVQQFELPAITITKMNNWITITDMINID